MRKHSRRATFAAGVIAAGLGQASADNLPAHIFQEQRIGQWRIGSSMFGADPACVMTQRGTGRGMLTLVSKPREIVEIALVGPPNTFSVEAETRTVIVMDGVEIWSPRVRYVSSDIVTFFDLLDRSATVGPGSLFETSGQMTVSFGSFTTEFDLRQSAEAMQVLTDCKEVLQAQALAEANKPPTESEAADVKRGLGTAMRGIAGGQPLIAQFQCSITGRDLTGLVDPFRRDQPKTITIGVGEDGSGFINGSTMTSAQVERGDGGELNGTAFSFQDVNRAISGGATPLPQMGTLTPEQNAALQAMPGLMNGMLGSVMGDRKRFMVVSLQQNNVVFFDLTPAGDTATLTAPDCVRTM